VGLVVTCQTDQVGVFHNGASEAVEGLAHVTLHHDVLNQVTAQSGDEGPAVGGVVLSGEDGDRLCFGHWSLSELREL